MTIQEMFYKGFMNGTVQRVAIPDYFQTSLSRPLRPYQQEAFQNLLMYMENEFDGRQQRPHLLFHMATGSGKTLIMAGAMLYLFEKGYRNFLFFVSHNNIVEKTKDNFLNASSNKYLFSQQITVNGKRIEIKKVDNFQGTSQDCVNLCLTSIQGLHSDLNSEKENAVTYDDFSDQPVVLISDEAHHMNTATKNGGVSSEDEHTRDWESTVMRIFNKDNGALPNILLEFTATADLTDPVIAKKYEDKVIFDYPLKKFREDLYSKDVEVIETDLAPLDRALQAMILSQYKRKLFASIKQNIKPVILFKSKTIADNKAIFEQFKNAISAFQVKDIDKIRARAKDDLKAAFDYFDACRVSSDNLILELQSDFSTERLLLVDGNNISPEKQILLNSLEDKDNEIRAIFAVDMLNEGWDVLNLYDIVRLYDTRDAAGNKPGKTTMQEAQLIGRGARYMPFVDPSNPALDADKRKYDGDAQNPLRVIEKLHYHSAHNPRYIQELHKALVDTGIIPDTTKQLNLFLKDDFKESRLYKKGYVFINERKTLAEVEDDGTIGGNILSKTFTVKMPTGKMRSGLIFGDNADSQVLTSTTISFPFKEIGKHIIRCAMNGYSTFNFDSLKVLYPQLKSCREFIVSESYLSKLSIKVIGRASSLAGYDADEKLYVAKSVLKELEQMLLIRGKTYKGTTEFKPYMVNKKFRDRITLNVAISASGTQEFGESMKTPKNPAYALDLSTVKWYAYNDNFGTSEEKALVKYIEGKMSKLEEKYDEIYLLRNEKDIKIFSFDKGQAFEPDFILFLRIKGSAEKYDNLQFFIEPKGGNLIAQDKWKNDFLKQIQALGEITWCTKCDSFNVWGLPFFNESSNTEFESAFKTNALEYVPEHTAEAEPSISWVIIKSKDVPAEKKYVDYLPVYSVRAACGSFEDNESIPEDGAEGWIDITSAGIKAKKTMFAVHAIGDSMQPKIKDGDICIFEQYGDSSAGSREGQIVLTQCSGKDDDYSCSYTIKKYHSEKEYSEDGTWRHSKIQLLPLNMDYSPIDLTPEIAAKYRTIGILKTVL